MALLQASSPHARGHAPVARIMLEVCAALLPALAVHVWLFGAGVLVQLALGIGTALICEAAVLLARRRSLAPALGDGSAALTGMLLALAVPSLAPWWITLLGCAFAIVVAKQLYGGLGYNPFNPAMAGYAMLLVSFPLEMSTWPSPSGLEGARVDLEQAARVIFERADVDGLSGATALDAVKTGLSMGRSVPELAAEVDGGLLGARGWEWSALAYLAGGLWLLARGIIGWRVPAATLAGLLVPAAVFHALDPSAHAGPVFHLLSGAAVFGAFFIATDPVSGSTTARGQLVFGAGVGVLTYVIRAFGGYPDGIAFAVLLMNTAVPTIDHYTRPRVFGARDAG